MYKTLIVEDEKWTRDALVGLIDWERHGIRLCPAAANGEEALALIERELPDILLTDIRMPGMSGLELIDRAKGIREDLEAIVVSGYDDFAYVQQALRLGVCDYLLKPFRAEDVVRVLEEAKRRIEEKRRQRHELDDIRARWRTNVFAVKSHVLSQWARYPKGVMEDRARVIAECGMAVEAKSPFQLGIVRLDRPWRAAPKEGELELIRYAASNILQETLEPFYQGRMETFRDGDDLAWIGNVPDTDAGKSALKAALELVKENVRAFLGWEVSIGVSDAGRSVDELCLAYAEAREALERRFFHGYGHVHLYSELGRTDADAADAADEAELKKLEQSIIQAVRTARYSDALDSLENWLERLRARPDLGRNKIQLLAMELIAEWKRFVSELNVEAIEWKNQLYNWVDEIPNVETIDELSAVMKQIFRSLVERLSSQKPMHKTVRQAIRIIEERYRTRLTLESVAKDVYVSPAYLSVLFKQETGTNFLDYLHQYRIARAKELLKEGVLKIYEIAEAVGYHDERHFSATFKKWTGVSPSQYQKQVGPYKS